MDAHHDQGNRAPAGFEDPGGVRSVPVARIPEGHPWWRRRGAVAALCAITIVSFAIIVVVLGQAARGPARPKAPQVQMPARRTVGVDRGTPRVVRTHSRRRTRARRSARRARWRSTVPTRTSRSPVCRASCAMSPQRSDGSEGPSSPGPAAPPAPVPARPNGGAAGEFGFER
jgi:hypothetical protein